MLIEAGRIQTLRLQLTVKGCPPLASAKAVFFF